MKGMWLPKTPIYLTVSMKGNSVGDIKHQQVRYLTIVDLLTSTTCHKQKYCSCL